MALWRYNHKLLSAPVELLTLDFQDKFPDGSSLDLEEDEEEADEESAGDKMAAKIAAKKAEADAKAPEMTIKVRVS